LNETQFTWVIGRCARRFFLREKPLGNPRAACTAAGKSLQVLIGTAFGVSATSNHQAIAESFRHVRCSRVEALDFTSRGSLWNYAAGGPSMLEFTPVSSLMPRYEMARAFSPSFGRRRAGVRITLRSAEPSGLFQDQRRQTLNHAAGRIF
jgi:hypothetical protein